MEEKTVERDYEQQVQELFTQHPELRSQELPEDVLKACVGGKRLTDAYADYADDRAKEQNEKAARQAPVRGVTKGGSVDTSPEDAFLRGFNGAW